MQIEAPDPRSPVKIAAEGSIQKRPMRLSGTIGPLSELPDPAMPYPVLLDGALDQIHLTVDGTIKKPREFAGVDLRLSVSGGRLADLASALGMPLPEVPDFRSTGKLTGGSGEWQLEALSLALGKSNLQGGISIDTNPKVPHIQANLTSSYIDLADFKGVYGGKPGHSSALPPNSSGRVLPDTPIAVLKLPGFSADAAFDAARIESVGGLHFERISLGMRLKDGTIDVKPLRFAIAQGAVDLSLHVAPSTTNGPPRLTADIDIRHVDLHRLLGDPTMPQIVRRTAGIAGGFVRIDTYGISMRDLLAHMNGDAGIFVENGRLSELLEQLAPINALGALGVYVRGDKPVPINCLVLRFDIKGGIATASTMLVDTNEDVVAGRGNVNFADETMQLSLSPYNKSFTIATLRTPVAVQGTFQKPEFDVKAGGLAARLGAAIGLGILFPPAALLPLIDAGLGENNACAKAYAAQRPPRPATGSSAPK